MTYDNNNRGLLWVNNRKQDDSYPDYQGRATIDNEEYWVEIFTADPLKMAFTLKEDRTRKYNGKLFRNPNRKAETHPDFRGTVDVEGEQYQIAMWVWQTKKTTRSPDLTIRLDKAEEEQPSELVNTITATPLASTPETGTQPEIPEEDDSDIPF